MSVKAACTTAIELIPLYVLCSEAGVEGIAAIHSFGWSLHVMLVHKIGLMQCSERGRK